MRDKKRNYIITYENHYFKDISVSKIEIEVADWLFPSYLIGFTDNGLNKIVKIEEIEKEGS